MFKTRDGLGNSCVLRYSRQRRSAIQSAGPLVKHGLSRSHRASRLDFTAADFAAANNEERQPMKKWMIVAVGASCIVASHPAFAQNVRAVTCTGILIDVWLKPRAEWPLAVIYDATDHFTCTIDRQNHGHDMKPCAAGEKCRVVGMARVFGYEEQGFQTYSRFKQLHRWIRCQTKGVPLHLAFIRNYQSSREVGLIWD